VKRFPALFSIILLSSIGFAQSYKFANYNTLEGLCDKFAYTINQDPQGFLWIGTDQGLCRFDGNYFEQVIKGDSIPPSIALSSLLDSRGRLWFGHENGLISVLDNGRFHLITPGDDLRTSVQAIREDADGNILVLGQQSGILVINPQLEITYSGNPTEPSDPFAGKYLNDFQVTADGDLLVGTNDGLSIFRYDEDLETYIETGNIANLQYLIVNEIEPSVNDDEYWVGTEDEGLFRMVGIGYNPEDYSVEKIGMDKGLEYSKITSIVFDGLRRVWITDYGIGLFRFDLDESGNLGSSVLFNMETGIPNAYINEVFIDEEGNQWFSSQGNGIAVLRDPAFTFFELWEDEESQDVSAIYVSGEDYWFGGQSRIAHVVNGVYNQITLLGVDNGLPDDLVTALYVDPNDDLYIGTAGSGLFIKRSGSSRILSLVISRNSPDNQINAIDGKSDTVFVATNNGVLALDPVTGGRTNYSTINGLPHNAINDILVDREGNAWIATKTSGLISINSGKQFLIEGRTSYTFVTLAEDDNGILWAGTEESGVFKFNDDSLGWYNSETGLFQLLTLRNSRSHQTPHFEMNMLFWRNDYFFLGFWIDTRSASTFLDAKDAEST
jgi:ligand-binding sensor domain-containing protein